MTITKSKEKLIKMAILALVKGEISSGSWGFEANEDELVSWQEVMKWIEDNM